MSLCRRKWIVVWVIVGTLIVANLVPIVHWLENLGIIDVAGWVSNRLITGTAMAVIGVLLWLVVDRPPMTTGGVYARRCRVCDRRLPERGRYCAHCGSCVADHSH